MPVINKPALLCFLLAGILIITGFSIQKTGEKYFQNITIQSEDTCFPMDQLQSLTESKALSSDRENQNTADSETNKENQNTATAWTEQQNEIIVDNSSGRNDQANVIAIYGSSHCLLPFGKNLSMEDPAGCLISRSVATNLFGNFSAENQQILWNGNLWTVRGVISIPAHCLIVQTAKRNLELSYDRISILRSKNDTTENTGDDFILQNNLAAHTLRFDYLYRLSWLPELIPGKWSDFDGWKNNWKKQRQEICQLKQEKQSTLETTGFTLEKQSRLLLAVGLLLCIGGTILLRKRKEKSLPSSTADSPIINNL